MRPEVKRYLLLGAALALPLLGPELSTAEEGDEGLRPREGADRWVPSLAVTSGILVQRQRGVANPVESSAGLPPGPTSGDDMAVAPFVGGNVEIMTPEVHSATGARFYASAELIPTFSSSRDPAKEGDPGDVRSPFEPGAILNPRQEDALGQGTKVSGEFDTLVFGAAFGVALPFTFMDWELRLKPHFAWMRYRVEAEGLAVKAICTAPVSPGSTRCPNDNSLFSSLSVDLDRSNSFHGIGPGLDLEVDTGRFGPLGSSLFIGSRVFHTLGDRDISFAGSSSVSFDDNGTQRTETLAADFNYEVKRWMYRAHIGFRVHWLGGSWD